MARILVSINDDGKSPKCKVRGDMGSHCVREAAPPEQSAKRQSEQCVEPDRSQDHYRIQRCECCHRRQMAHFEQDRGKRAPR